MTDFFERHGAACFPVQPNNKEPLPGWSWTKNFSRDPAQWREWLSEGHGLAINAGASGFVVVDIDTKDIGRDEAWSLYCGLCAEWGIPVAQPAWQTQHGGWHVIFRAPEGVALRQPDAIKGRINIRAGNGYVVCPPSKGYAMLDGATVHDAPPALVAHCSGSKRKSSEHRSRRGEHSLRDTRSMLKFMSEDSAFDAYEDWISIGQALKICFLDDGLEMWESITVPGKYTCEEKWPTFKDEDDGNAVTLATWFQKAQEAGWRLSLAEMFADIDVAQLAANAGAKERRGLRARRVNAASLADKPVPERKWLVPGLIPANNVTLLYGDGGTGKSLLALQLAAAGVAGSHFFGRPVTQGRVEFVTAEDSVDEMHRRLVDVARATAVPIDGLNGLHLTSLADEDAILAAPEDGRGGALVATALYAELDSVIAESQPTLLVLDTLADVFGGNEIIRSQVRQFISMLRKLCLRHGCTIVVLAHPSLAGMDKGTSGSTGWSNSVRSRLYFQRVHKNDDGQEPDEDARVLRVGKSNYGRVGLEIAMRWQAGVFVPMALTAGGDPLLMAAKAERVFLELLAKYTSQDRAVSLSTGANYAPKMFDAAARPQGIGKRALAEAMGRLLDTGRIVNVPYGPPSRGTKRLVASNPIAAPQG